MGTYTCTLSSKNNWFPHFWCLCKISSFSTHKPIVEHFSVFWENTLRPDKFHFSITFQPNCVINLNVIVVTYIEFHAALLRVGWQTNAQRESLVNSDERTISSSDFYSKYQVGPVYSERFSLLVAINEKYIKKSYHIFKFPPYQVVCFVALK